MNLHEYLAEAEQCLRSNHINDVSEDAISYVATYMIRADKLYDGRGNQRQFRFMCGKCGIRNWLRAKKSSRRQKLIIDSNIFSSYSSNALIKIIANNDLRPEFYTEYNNLMKDIENILTEKQYRCFIESCLNKKKKKDLAVELGVSKQCINHHIQSAIAKIRKNLSKYENILSLSR